MRGKQHAARIDFWVLCATTATTAIDTDVLERIDRAATTYYRLMEASSSEQHG